MVTWLSRRDSVRRVEPQRDSGDGLLLAVARSAAALLRAPRVLDALPEVLPLIGKTAGVHRAYVHRVGPHPGSGVPSVTEIANWESPELDIRRHRPQVVNAPLTSLASWLGPLQQGEAVQGVASEFPTAERAVMEHFGTVSVLAMPVFVSGELGGIIGFDDCREERRFEPRQLVALQALAANLGALWERELADERAAASEAMLRETLEAEARLTGALARFGGDLLRTQHEPDLPDRLCAEVATMLRCESVYGLLWREEEGAFVLSGTHGLQAKLTDLGHNVHVPRDRVDLDSIFATSDIIEASPSPLPMSRLANGDGSGCCLLLALRHGSGLIGVLSASRVSSREPFSETERRIAREIAQIASLTLENARLLVEHSSASRLKSEFVATMSHELRTPLGVILGFSEMLEAEELGSLADEQREALFRIQRSARTLADIIEGTLDLGRIEAGREQVARERVDVGQLLEKIHTSFDLGRRASLHVDPRLQPVSTDPSKLDVIVRNLVNNAVKFCPKGEIRLSAHPSGDGVEVAVSDAGIGIPEGERSAIFEAFRQVGGHGHGGVGLGLHIVKRLVDLLDGQVDVESEPGRGSTFVVRLPNLP